ncbi:MAG TPA: pyridoxal-phosphate dependent enzyme [Acidimicrobiales bacterium]
MAASPSSPFTDLRLVDGGRYVPDPVAWRPADGRPWRLAPAPPPLRPDDLAGRPPGLWRYREALPFADPEAAAARCGLGEGGTPLVDLGDGLTGKLELASPTLSFKDRGATVLVAAAAALGVERIVCDSSGNAGTAIAAYAARAGLPAVVFVPAATSPAKLVQARAHGAEIRTVPGDRAAAARAAEDEVERTGAFYASHAWNPLFLEGTKTYAYELWEQRGFAAPGAVVVPAGNGTLFLGALKGFAELRAAGLVDRLPAFVVAQAAACAPLWHAVHGRAAAPADVAGPTIAEGIAIAQPPRLEEMVAAVRQVGARVEVVADDEIVRARDDLARRGLFVEPTAAVPYAVARRIRRELPADCVVPLCGAGLKAVTAPAGPAC